MGAPAGARSGSGGLAAFDEMIAEVRAQCVWEGARTVAAPAVGGPLACGPHAGRGAVLRSRMACELGGGAEGACALVLPTADDSLVRDGLVTVAGPDVAQAARGAVLPFAQVVLVAGTGLDEAAVQGLAEAQAVRDWVGGCQVRSTPGAVFVRVSAVAAEAGFGLGHLGRALMELLRATDERVSAVEVLFATASPERVKALYPLRERWLAACHDLRRAQWAALGVDIDCAGGVHCGRCKDKAVCDQVRRIAGLRRAAGQRTPAPPAPRGQALP